MEVLDAPGARGGPRPAARPGAVRELPYAAWVNIQTGCDNSCAFCIVPSVRGPEVSRPLDDIVAEVELLAQRGVTEVTLLGQNVNSYGRDLTRRRPLFAELLRAVGAVEGIGRVRFTSPHPKDLRPETIEAMAETPEVCEQLHLPLQSGSDRVLARHAAGLHRASATSSGWPRPGPPSTTWPSRPTSSSASPARPRTTSRTRSPSAPRPATTARSPSSSRPARAPGPPPWSRAFVPTDVIAERFERLKTVVDRSALARHQARVGRSEEVLVEGVSRRDDDDAERAHPPGQAASTSPPRAPPAAPAPGRPGPGDRDGAVTPTTCRAGSRR